MKFEWDENKNRINLQKHGIDFSDAVKIFDGPALIYPDNRIDYGEDRYIGIGFILNLVALVVFVEINDNDVIRIISARKANRHESKKFKKAIKNRLG
ncbi:conserved hypothetical protein [Desulfamplus magnetovallimortis]|uniref:BrnT family toxin n=1 Tax=Desulfamplus magnetovallimortis TaxID=1246637 RepID=A0A1W1HHP6_9BACT|nr:BrnT family toxin [Desulfamplus magnetovallimortis]SLM31953.1 conserved hypothetical protein [Desulfamplus magnetovallimortis]